jgi:hypothetical protein
MRRPYGTKNIMRSAIEKLVLDYFNSIVRGKLSCCLKIKSHVLWF